MEQREISEAALGHGEITEGLPEVAGEAVEQRDAGFAQLARGDEMLCARKLAGDVRNTVVSAAEIAPVVFGAGGGGAVGPVVKVFRTLTKSGGAFEAQVFFIAGGDPCDD